MMADLLPLFLFVVVMVGTPGPANMVLMTAGASFGFSRAIPFLLGITFGKLMLNLMMGFGFYDVLESYPIILDGLKYISAVYVIYLSVQMARQPLGDSADLSKVPGFLAGVIVHPLNPKAWAMMTIAWADYGGQIEDPLWRVVIISGTLLCAQLCAHSFWCLAGDRLMGSICNDRTKTLIQQGLAALTALVVLIVIL